MTVLYSADVCPFAQRTRALLTRLEVPFETRTVDLDDRDEEFLELTPTGRVPLLVDGAKKLYESMVINDYLAEKHGFATAYPGDPYAKARARLAMLQWDNVALGSFYESLKGGGLDDGKRTKVSRELEEIQTTVQMMGGTDNLLAFHCAPFWARMGWLKEMTDFSGLVDAHAALRTWLDRTLTIDAVRSTLPDREETVRRYREKFGG